MMTIDEVPKTCTHTIDHSDVVQIVEFSPFDWSSRLIAVGSSSRISIGTILFQEEDKEVEGLEYEVIREFHHSCRLMAFAWSPATSLRVLPKALKFCTAGADKKIRYYSSDLKTDDAVRVIDGHTDYVNDLIFDPDKGEQIASVSDDLTCRLFDTDGHQVAVYPLGSPGMSVKWHQEDPVKLMVGEKNGTIRFYNLIDQQPILSLACGNAPLLSVDWCHSNALSVSAVVGTELLLFDTSKSSRPSEKKQVHSDGARCVRWAKCNESIVATTGCPGSQLKVFNFKLNQTPICTSSHILNGLSWHYKLPIVAVGGDKKVFFWTVDNA
ncbi:nucleoporin Nup37-like [Lineus longissimus]|uniref:nucleoporin Nup37-like n=1 Tax=Lineus longissimus TaxID=88925 RepID=UPI002B4D9F25